jgi:hypothetical protein
MSEKISDIFDVAPIPGTAIAEAVIKPTKVHDDADFARANLRALITTAQTALQHALDVAVQSESPRAYEVLATFINAAADLNTKLIGVHQTEAKIATPVADTPVAAGPVTNNIVFTGTTEELNNLLMKKVPNEIIGN